MEALKDTKKVIKALKEKIKQMEETIKQQQQIEMENAFSWVVMMDGMEDSNGITNIDRGGKEEGKLYFNTNWNIDINRHKFLY